MPKETPNASDSPGFESSVQALPSLESRRGTVYWLLRAAKSEHRDQVTSCQRNVCLQFLRPTIKMSKSLFLQGAQRQILLHASLLAPGAWWQSGGDSSIVDIFLQILPHFPSQPCLHMVVSLQFSSSYLTQIILDLGSTPSQQDLI